MDQALRSIPSHRTTTGVVPDRLLIAAFLLGCALFLFIDARTAPLVLWDESRNAVNALEMHRTGFSLVTTYGFQPDLWNTKPPLLIWAMTASVSLFGPSEWALRLPAAMAALGTLLCLILFVRKVTGSLGTGLVAALLLVLSPGFFGEHGARTADFDVVLLFFVTAALQVVFFAVHRVRPERSLVVALGAALALAAMTKTIAAFIPFFGAALYVVWTRRTVRVLRGWLQYLVAAIIALAPMLLFYAAREATSPGYLQAVLHNDMGGRFGQRITGVETTPAYYIAELLRGWFFAGPLLLCVLLALRHVRGKDKALLHWSLFVAGGTLAVFTAGSTRLIHYALPAFPWLAVATAVSFRVLGAKFIVAPWREKRSPVLVVACIALSLIALQLTYRAAWWRYVAFPGRQSLAQNSYGTAFAALAARGIHQVHVVDPGFVLEGVPGYVPLLQANALLWAGKLRVTHSMVMPASRNFPLVSCEPAATDFWRTPGVERVGDCGLIMPR